MSNKKRKLSSLIIKTEDTTDTVNIWSLSSAEKFKIPHAIITTSALPKDFLASLDSYNVYLLFNFDKKWISMRSETWYWGHGCVCNEDIDEYFIIRFMYGQKIYNEFQVQSLKNMFQFEGQTIRDVFYSIMAKIMKEVNTLDTITTALNNGYCRLIFAESHSMLLLEYKKFQCEDFESEIRFFSTFPSCYKREYINSYLNYARFRALREANNIALLRSKLGNSQPLSLFMLENFLSMSDKFELKNKYELDLIVKWAYSKREQKWFHTKKFDKEAQEHFLEIFNK